MRAWRQPQHRCPEGVVIASTQALVLDPELGALGLAQEVQGEASDACFAWTGADQGGIRSKAWGSAAWQRFLQMPELSRFRTGTGLSEADVVGAG